MEEYRGLLTTFSSGITIIGSSISFDLLLVLLIFAIALCIKQREDTLQLKEEISENELIYLITVNAQQKSIKMEKLS